MATVFETADLDVAEQILRDTYGGNIRLDSSSQQTGIRLETVPVTSSLQLDRIDFAVSFGLTADPHGRLVISHVRSGRIAYRTSGSQQDYGPGDAFIPHQPGHSFTARCEQTVFDTAVLDPVLPSQIADTAPGRTQQPIRFTSHQPVSAQAARTWADTCAYLRDAVLDTPDAAQHPLFAASAARFLAATLLAVFPNNALTDPTIEDRHDAHPSTVRRAVAFIDEHAEQDGTIADIAAAASVTIRAVQLAFRRHLDTTPMAYLRRVRLDHAHHELLAANPADTTVTAVAYRWGFSNASRFTTYYRSAYGVSPSHTLRK